MAVLLAQEVVVRGQWPSSVSFSLSRIVNKKSYAATIKQKSDFKEHAMLIKIKTTDQSVLFFGLA